MTGRKHILVYVSNHPKDSALKRNIILGIFCMHITTLDETWLCLASDYNDLAMYTWVRVIAELRYTFYNSTHNLYTLVAETVFDHSVNTNFSKIKLFSCAITW